LQHADIIAQAMSHALDKPFNSDNILNEALSAIVLFCKTNPTVICAKGDEWVPKVICLCMSELINVRDKALHILQQLVSHHPLTENVHTKIVTIFFKNDAVKFAEQLSQIKGKDKQLLKIWSCLVQFFGKWLKNDQTPFLPALLQMMEVFMNKPVAETRKLACQAWERMITAFTATPCNERAYSFMASPLLALFRTEQAIEVREAAFRTWLKIFVEIDGQFGQSATKVIFPALESIIDDKSQPIRKYSMLILNKIFSSPHYALDYAQEGKTGRSLSALQLKGVDAKWKRNESAVFVALYEKAISAVVEPKNIVSFPI
jgi:hypothetical protein